MGLDGGSHAEGLYAGQAEELTKLSGGNDWLRTGDYAVISFHSPN